MTVRETFVNTTTAALDSDPRIALVLADVSADRFTAAARRHPDRVINVGIREQAMIGIAGGLALSGMRPVVHTIAPFLVERPFEQIKISLDHQDAAAVLVSNGASYDYSQAGRTHMSPGDVALLDALPGWTVHVPGHPAEVEALLRTALAGEGRVYLRLSEQTNPRPEAVGPGWSVLRRGERGVVLAVGPMLGPVLQATSGLPVTVLYTATVRPFDSAGLNRAVEQAAPDVVLVEPYLSGTSAHLVAEALATTPHRVLPLGVRRDVELRAYGTPEEHAAVHGLDPAALAARIRAFLG